MIPQPPLKSRCGVGARVPSPSARSAGIHRGILAAGVGPALALLVGCTLTDIGDYELERCDTPSRCDAMNEHEGLGAGDCAIYQCRGDETGCELRPRDLDGDGYLPPECAPAPAATDCDDQDEARHPGATEACDLVDNDCDAAIDEDGVWAGLIPLDESEAPFPGGGVTFSAAVGAGTIAAALWGEGNAHVASVPGEARGPLSYGYQLEQDTAGPSTSLATAGKCPDSAEVGAPGTACNFAEAAATQLDDEWLVAAISTEGCSHGQLRLGYLAGSTLDLHGPDAQSNVYLGVSREGRCTGAHRSDGPLGAARLALAGLQPDNHFAQVLVGYLADSHERATCPSTDVGVEVLGAWLEMASFDPDLKWVNASNDGVPERLGTTHTGEAPIVLGWSSGGLEGYFVVFPDAAGGVSAHFLPAFEEPAAYALGAAEPRHTSPLELTASTAAFGGESVATLGAAVRSLGDGAAELGLAWTDGCGDEATELYFASLRYELGSRGFDSSSVTSLGASPSPIVGRPALAHSSRAVTVTAAAALDANAEPLSSVGSWLLAWEAASGDIYGMRVLGNEGRAVDPPTLLVEDARFPYVTGAESSRTDGAPELAHLPKGHGLTRSRLCGG